MFIRVIVQIFIAIVPFGTHKKLLSELPFYEAFSVKLKILEYIIYIYINLM